MRIERKIILSDTFKLVLIVLIGIFALQNINLVLTKLRFVEIADDLNASFLEMRLSEKNFFLYKDEKALPDIRTKINKTMRTIELAQKDVVRAVGEENLQTLRLYLKNYSDVVEEIGKSNNRDAGLEIKLRTEGRKLKEFSENIAHIERLSVNDIFSRSKRILFYCFVAIFLSAIVVSHFLSQKIVRSLREIENLAKTISEGKFDTIEGINTRDELGSVITAINSMSDELRHREEQIIQSKKLASLGVLTAGVAHELTNPVNNISMIAQTYAELYDKLSREQRIEFMTRIDGETDRVKNIVKNLLDFSKPKEAELEETDINTVIHKTLLLMQNTLDVYNIETKLNLKDGLPRVFIDGHQIQQVLVNLITNAVQAMPNGGKIIIASRTGASKDHIEITVMDSGKGIPPEYLPHIFDPFFSTKGEGGTGLGLSVSYGIIKNHKGEIRVASKVGVGTTFTIDLPVNKKQEEINV
ncbi:MAG: HAMP domain-containing protein [Nitrospirae bacterium]|nr:HAMP domain-containing protein [Nitrospirota bacterium]